MECRRLPNSGNQLIKGKNQTKMVSRTQTLSKLKNGSLSHSPTVSVPYSFCPTIFHFFSFSAFSILFLHLLFFCFSLPLSQSFTFLLFLLFIYYSFLMFFLSIYYYLFSSLSHLLLSSPLSPLLLTSLLFLISSYLLFSLSRLILTVERRFV